MCNGENISYENIRIKKTFYQNEYLFCKFYYQLYI